MANTRYIAVRPLEPGKPVDVLERDELGALVGAWHGYWNYNRGTVGLYPNPRNKYVNWPGGRIPEKRIVSDRVVYVAAQKAVLPPKAELPKVKTESSGRELEGQQKMKF